MWIANQSKIKVYEDGTIRYWSVIMQSWRDRVAPTGVSNEDRMGLSSCARTILDGACRAWLERYPGTID